MKKNVGTADRVVRILAAMAIASLLLTGQIQGVAGTVLGILAIVFLGTGIVRTCPLYLPFKISTRK